MAAPSAGEANPHLEATGLQADAVVSRKQAQLNSSLPQDLLREAAAALRQAYDLVPQVSLGKVSAADADAVVEQLHDLFNRMLQICSDVDWLERRTSEVLDPRRLQIWRRHLEIVSWSRAWATLRGRQRTLQNAETIEGERTASSIGTTTEPLAVSFMHCFAEELKSSPNRILVAELESFVCARIAALREQQHSWQQLTQVPALWNFPAAATTRFHSFLEALQLSLGPAPSTRCHGNPQAGPLPHPTVQSNAVNCTSEGVRATAQEKSKRGYSGPPALPGEQSLAAPPEAFGLSYCCCAGRDPRFLSVLIGESQGMPMSTSDERKYREAAHRFNAAVARRASAAGREEVARVLRTGGWPGEAAYRFFAAELGGSLLLKSVWDDDEFLFGAGPIALHVHHDLTETDPDGNSYDNFELLQSWIPSRTKSKQKGKRRRRGSSDGGSGASRTIPRRSTMEGGKPKRRRPREAAERRKTKNRKRFKTTSSGSLVWRLPTKSKKVRRQGKPGRKSRRAQARFRTRPYRHAVQADKSLPRLPQAASRTSQHGPPSMHTQCFRDSVGRRNCLRSTSTED